MKVMPWNGPFQILSVDGGGIRGLFSAAVLAQLETDLGIRIADHFDMLAGTSTGGIIALALGLGLRPIEIAKMYVAHGAAIFPQASGWLGRAEREIRGLRRRKYDAEPLAVALKGFFGDARLGDSRKRLVIPSYNLGRDEVRIFKTPHHSSLRRDWKLPAWEVAMATCAAPTYFPAWRGIDGLRLIDGGVWANNPTLVALTEAKCVVNVPLEQVRILSLGTCEDVASRPDALDQGGVITWCRGAVEVLMRGQSVGTDNIAALLIGRERIRRLDPRVPSGTFALDKASSVDKLLAEASHASLHFAPVFKADFVPHLAGPFAPAFELEPVGGSK